MARYKKRPNLFEGRGLFDDYENESSDPLRPLDFSAEPADRPRHFVRLEGGMSVPEYPPLDPDDPDFPAGSGEIFGRVELAPTGERWRFISFGSGSSGNCAYLGNDQAGFLIDAGVDADYVEKTLLLNGVDMSSVKGICLTHDHGDHIRYVYQLLRRHRHMALFCTRKAFDGILRRHSISRRIKDYHHPIYKETPFQVAGFVVTAFDVMHDGSDNAGFFIARGNQTMAVATDLGCITERADFYMRRANFLMIEANYDLRMLNEGSYPEYLKNRIRRDNGHLDNALTAAYLARIYSDQLKWVFLCHLSHDNNTPDLALRTVTEAFRNIGVEPGDGSETPYARRAPLQIITLPRFEATSAITLRM